MDTHYLHPSPVQRNERFVQGFGVGMARAERQHGAVLLAPTEINKGERMDATSQMNLIMQTIKAAEAEGKMMSIEQAQRKLHRDYVTNQLWQHGWRPSGFLVAAKLCEGETFNPDKKLLTLFNNFLDSKGKLTGEQGVRLREAMDAFGIDYMNSPTYPLEPLKNSAA